MSPVAKAPADNEWISLAAVSRLLGGKDPSSTKSVLLANRVAINGVPGSRLRYNRQDVERLLQS